MSKFWEEFKEEIAKPKLWADVFKTCVGAVAVMLIRSAMQPKKSENRKEA